MKILAGRYKGRNFYMPAGIRPTTNIVRKALFDILGQDLSDMNFLDLFAGSGAMGLEALSRGAKECTLVESDPKAARVIEENIVLLRSKAQAQEGTCEVVPKDAFATIKMLARKAQKFHVVFADPPYGRDLAKKALKNLGTHDIVHPNSLVIIQHDKHENLPENQGRFFLEDKRKFGASVLSFYK